jgi:hypothetical protein
MAEERRGQVSEIFSQLLAENVIFEDVKKTIKNLVQSAEKHTYHAFIGN